MKEIDTDKLLIYAVSILLVTLLVPVCQSFRRTRGKNIVFHVAFVLVGAVLLFLVPDEIQHEIFSPGGVVVVGTILPLYSSIVSICTPDESDDVVWLQYWIASGSLSYATEWIDEIRQYFPQGGEHWYEFELLFTLWLMLPFTDGATLVYDTLTVPYIAPTARKIKTVCEGWIELVLVAINSWYLWIVWFTFLTWPEEQRRFVVVAVGTIYPMAASTVALTTDSDKMDETRWLTYWSSFNVLFLAMDYLENFVGHIPGFYSLCLVATVYLFLPMFDGAEIVFRRVLVPLSGQYENLLLHDAYLVRRSMEKSIPRKHHDRVMQRAAELFHKSKEKDN